MFQGKPGEVGENWRKHSSIRHVTKCLSRVKGTTVSLCYKHVAIFLVSRNLF